MSASADNLLDGGSAPRVELPRWLLWSVLGVCVLPLGLLALGLDLGAAAGARAGAASAEGMHLALAGSFTHVVLEWTACCAALVTAALAFVHFRFTRDVTTPVLGVALFCAGVADGLHALASVRLLGGIAELESLVPLTWVVSRLFTGAILVAGVGFVLLRRPERVESQAFVLVAGVVCAVLAWAIIRICAFSLLPQIIHPESLLTRPWDLPPLVLFALAAAPLLWLLHARRPSLFSHALLVSLVPSVAAQLYMAFGSSAVHDASFNVAHVLKIVAYAIPLAGLVMDYERSFTARALAGEALRSSEERFELAIAGTSDGIWDWKPQTNELWLAPRFKELLGYRDDELESRLEVFHDHLHPDDHRDWWNAVEDHLRRGEPFDVEIRMRTRNGQYRWFRARALAARDAAGEPVRMAGSIQDIDDRKEAIDQLESLSQRLAQANTEFAVDARTDPLTRLVNRRAWEEAVSIEDERCRRHDHPYAMLMLDIDHFKKFNDTAGHLEGDECLKTLARCLRTSCRIIDVIGRYGGEEFVVLLPETDLQGGRIVATRIIEAVRAEAVPHPGLGANAVVTVSVGLAAGPHPDGWKTVLDLADQALYRAKAGGRDTLVIDNAA